MASIYGWPGLTSLLLLSHSFLSSAQTLTPPSAPLANWTYNGCYTDNVNSRALIGKNYASGNAMTGAQCVSFCAKNNFYYAGTEYAAECYCGSSLQSSGVLASDQSTCNMACNGTKFTIRAKVRGIY
ncbi:WSC-domain-containing protein [Polyplosphaeria fusca]|uniref:WSC-domain-containing protein n=1 Tax=Polyplosphaeria fusca TaxID=682080 RepID=A0A9P4R8H9_9PLEO|nr:WSC-domain-containing protein [Polyplosphaeria fusca]